MRTKYKYIKILLLCSILVGTSLFAAMAVAPRTVHADPVPTCEAPAVLNPETANNPAYCSCPTGQYLITGDTNTCSANCPDGDTPGTDAGGNKFCNPAVAAPSDSGGTDSAATSGNCSSTSNCDLINTYINPFINFLGALVGVAVVISLIIGGIQYGSSAGDPQKVSAAKNRIRNAIIALVTFLFLYAILNFLIPGGLL